jgi:hypothetical protein
MTSGESPPEQLPEPAETPVRAVPSEGEGTEEKSKPPGTRRRRAFFIVPILAAVWIAAYLNLGTEELTEAGRASWCGTADEIEVLTEEELLVYQDPPGEGQEPDEVIREQFRQTAARMLLLYVRLGEIAPGHLVDDLEEVATDYQAAVRSRDPSVARELRNSDASKRVDSFTEQTC